jgi:hypothetical protein
MQLIGVRSDAGRNVPVGELLEALVASLRFGLDEAGKEAQPLHEGVEHLLAVDSARVSLAEAREALRPLVNSENCRLRIY